MGTFIEEMQTATANIHPDGAVNFLIYYRHFLKDQKEQTTEGITFAFLEELLNKHMKGHQSAFNNLPCVFFLEFLTATVKGLETSDAGHLLPHS